MLIKLKEHQKLLQNNLETNKEEILREKYISPKLRHKVVDDLRLKGEKF